MQQNALFWILFLTALAVGVDGYGQKKKAEPSLYDSYKSRLTYESPSDLLDQAERVKVEQPARAVSLVQEALGLSLAEGNKVQEARAYIMLGEVNEQIAEWKLAKENFQSGLKIVREIKPARGQHDLEVKALEGMARSSLRLQQHDQALQHYNEALALTRSPELRTNLYVGLSEVHYDRGDYEAALKALENIASGKLSRDKEDIRINSQRAKIYARMNNAEKAEDALISSQSTLRNSLDAMPSAAPKQQADFEEAKEEVAEVLHEQKRFDDEISLRNRSIDFNLESKNLGAVARDKVGLGKALEAKGETSEAIRELEEAALMADTIKNPKDQAKAYLALASLYEKNNRPSRAIDAFKRYSHAVEQREAQAEADLIEKADLIRQQRGIEELTKNLAIEQREETIAQATVFRQRLIIYGLIFIVAIASITSYFTYKNARASRIANQLLALKSLRSQMNPHFIFNALNSVNQFVAQNDERAANKFLSEFSRLMRLVLENSQEDFIPLYKEHEIIALYLKLEHYRFRDKFDYALTVDEALNLESLEIPPMLIQPYIENAVWHGLRYKETKGFLSVHLRAANGGIEVEVSDDGIGRQKSMALKTVHQKKQDSTGLKNIQQRLQIINSVYRKSLNVEVSDLDTASGTGTTVRIFIPSTTKKRQYDEGGNHR